jgi:iron(III) transport system permease protein
LVLATAWLSLLPLLRLAAEAVWASGHVFTSPPVIRALVRSVVTSFGGALVALALGGAYATAVALTDAGARRLLSVAALLPLLIPAQIIALAWIQMLSPGGALPGWFAGVDDALYSGWGIALLLGVEHMPIVFLAARAAMAAIPGELIEAARADGAHQWRVLRRIVLPLASPGLIVGFGLAMVACLGSFGVPAMIGIPARYPTLAVLIYQRLTGFGATMLPDAAALAMALAVVSGAAGVATGWAARRVDAGTVGGGAGGTGRIELGAWRTPVTLSLLAVSAIVMVLPLASLIAASLSRAYGVPLRPGTATFDHYITVLHTAETWRAFTTSAWLAAAAALSCIVVAVPAALLRSWGDRQWLRRLIGSLDPIVDAPYALPGIVLAIGMILLYSRPLPLLRTSLYGTPWIMLLAYIPRFLPLALRPVQAALARIDPVMDEAARAQGARFFRRLFAIALPLLGPGAAAAGILVLLTAFGELTVSALLWSPGHETVGVLIFSLNEGGNIAEAAAVSVLCLLCLFPIAGSTALLPSSTRRVLPWSG